MFREAFSENSKMSNYKNILSKEFAIYALIIFILTINAFQFIEIQNLKRKISTNRVQIIKLKRELKNLEYSSSENQDEIEDLKNRVDDLESEISDIPSPQYLHWQP
jgi:chromosome segregation ATPase